MSEETYDDLCTRYGSRLCRYQRWRQRIRRQAPQLRGSYSRRLSL